MKMRFRLCFVASAALALCICQSHAIAQGGNAFIEPGNQEPSSAVDASGRHYRGSDYPRATPPWWQDRVKGIAPEYPFGDRRKRHEGAGRFKLTLDLRTGLVSGVVVVRSTGYKTLDGCAVVALRQWRWKPGKWRELELPVSFTMSRATPRPNSIRLPNT